MVKLSSLAQIAGYPARALSLFAAAVIWWQQQQQPRSPQQEQQQRKEGFVGAAAPSLAGAVSACMAAAQEYLPHMQTASIVQLLVSLAALEACVPGLVLQPAAAAGKAAAAVDQDVALLLELAVRELGSQQHRGLLMEQPLLLAEAVQACRLLGVAQQTMERLQQ